MQDTQVISGIDWDAVFADVDWTRSLREQFQDRADALGFEVATLPPTLLGVSWTLERRAARGDQAARQRLESLEAWQDAVPTAAGQLAEWDATLEQMWRRGQLERRYPGSVRFMLEGTHAAGCSSWEELWEFSRESIYRELRREETLRLTRQWNEVAQEQADTRQLLALSADGRMLKKAGLL